MLEFQNVTIYQKKSKILDNLNLKLEDGVIFSLIGSDREAKETILRAASSCEKPARGRVMLNGVSVYSSPNAYLLTGYMPRNVAFYEHLTVEEYYELFLGLYRVNGRYQKKRVEEVLSLLELEHFRKHFLSEVPAEIKTFLALGKTILHEPSWLFLDEPFDNLSSQSRKKMLDCLGMLWEQGISLVMNTEMYPELTSFVTDIALIENGQMTSCGTLESVYKDALKASPVRMRVMDGMEVALRVLRENDLVNRVTVSGEDVILLFSGGDREEAELLRQLVSAGALIHSFVRDPMDLDQFVWR